MIIGQAGSGYAYGSQFANSLAYGWLFR